MLASRRNRAFASLAEKLRDNQILKTHLSKLTGQNSAGKQTDWRQNLEPLREVSGGSEFLEELDGMVEKFLDITVGSDRLIDQAESILSNLLEMSESHQPVDDTDKDSTVPNTKELESRLFEAVGEQRREEATEMLRIGRLSWRLRDDDNLLVSRIESQLYRAAADGVDRLRVAGRLKQQGDLCEEAVPLIVNALRNRSCREIELPCKEASVSERPAASSATARQLVGQPAAPGIASGIVRRIEGPESFAGFRAGEVLVCDAIQPMMTHLVPLAAAVVERRGGMLIHGAIIAREMGIPCANGIVDAMEMLADGDFVTVDGHLGIVTVGLPEFDLELEVTSSEEN